MYRRSMMTPRWHNVSHLCRLSCVVRQLIHAKVTSLYMSYGMVFIVGPWANHFECNHVYLSEYRELPVLHTFGKRT